MTKLGKHGLRGTLVESAWRGIVKDPALRQAYERIKARAGTKRAIVAVARRVLLRSRRLLLDEHPATAMQLETERRLWPLCGLCRAPGPTEIVASAPVVCVAILGARSGTVKHVWPWALRARERDTMRDADRTS